MKITGLNLHVLARIASGDIRFELRRGRLCVAAVHASHVHRLIAAGLLGTDGVVTADGRRQLASRAASPRASPLILLHHDSNCPRATLALSRLRGDTERHSSGAPITGQTGRNRASGIDGGRPSAFDRGRGREGEP